MQYVTLGKTGLKISRMGFGGIPIQRIDREGTKVLMERLLEEGINYIDTARGYTVSEEFLGYALEGIRDRFVLATKSMSRTNEAMAADIEKSLSNLRTDYIDLYQVHNPNLEQLEQVISPGGALEALLEAKEAGKIGHIGLTAHSVAVFDRALELPSDVGAVRGDVRLRGDVGVRGGSAARLNTFAEFGGVDGSVPGIPKYLSSLRSLSLETAIRPLSPVSTQPSSPT